MPARSTPTKGILLGAPNLSQATVDLPIAKLLDARYDVPAALLNDVQVAAMGEGTFGAGKGCDDFFCVFVGTGVGGAIVHDGQLATGATGTAGEVGHLIIHANGRHCGCGGRGHLEAYASRTAITRTILGELKRGRIGADQAGTLAGERGRRWQHLALRPAGQGDEGKRPAGHGNS